MKRLPSMFMEPEESNKIAEINRLEKDFEEIYNSYHYGTKAIATKFKSDMKYKT